MDLYPVLSCEISCDKEIESDNMKKSELPTKICLVCNRPFSWWEKWGKN